MSKGRWIALLAACLCGIALAAILLAQPDSEEISNVRYWAWKHGLARMNLDRALDEMVNDTGRDSVVLGKTKSELDAEFGFTIPVEQADSYVQYCYKNSQYTKSKAIMLRQSHWMVLMRDGRAVELIRVSGC